MDRLLESLKLPRGDLLQSREALVEEALDATGRRIAYAEKSQRVLRRRPASLASAAAPARHSAGDAIANRRPPPC